MNFPRPTKHILRVRTFITVYGALALLDAGLDIDGKEFFERMFSCDCLSEGLKGIPPVDWDSVDPDSKAVGIKAITHREEIAKELSAFLDGWLFSRLPLVTQAIMLVAYSEAVLVKCTPKQVAINEALIILKQFGSETETKYVNAVLEQAISKGLNIPTDYKGPGKVHITKADLLPDRSELEAIAKGLATPVAPTLPDDKEN